MSDDILDADAIDALRLKAFKTNKPADRDAYHRAVSKWFQDRHAREMRREMDLSDHPAVKQMVEEAVAAERSKMIIAVQRAFEHRRGLMSVAVASDKATAAIRGETT